MPPKPWQSAFSFDETYAWENFCYLVYKLQQGESLVFYGFGKKLKFRKIGAGNRGDVLITSEDLNAPEEIELKNQRRFEKVFMSSILKDPNKHTHCYERSETKHKDWRKQIYRCVDPDCNHYTQSQFIIGKRARCHQCKNEMIIEKDQVKNFAVLGLCCSKSKRAKLFRETAARVENSGIFEGLDFDSQPGLQENSHDSHDGMLSLLKED